MKESKQFTPTEKKVIELLMQGKSNKTIALALGIEIPTVEFHMGNIFTKLNVHSRTEAMAQLGKSIGMESPKDSRVVEKDEAIYHQEETAAPTISQSSRLPKYLLIVGIIVLLIVTYLLLKDNNWRYTREAEFPDEFTTGQDIGRSHASDERVHGQFGSQNTDPWAPQPGFAAYYGIKIPKSGSLYLQLRYSKNGKSSVPILIYLDAETEPRRSIYLIDQGNWNTFTQTDWINLGDIQKGTHTIRFETNGQEFGVADLDQFVLTTDPPK